MRNYACRLPVLDYFQIQKVYKKSRYKIKYVVYSANLYFNIISSPLPLPLAKYSRQKASVCKLLLHVHNLTLCGMLYYLERKTIQ